MAGREASRGWLTLVLSLVWSGAHGSPMDGFLRPVFGSPCLPLDVRSLLKSELREAVTQKCASLVEARGTRVCTSECRDALLGFRDARCYNYLSQSQRLQPRTDMPLHPRAGNALTLTALQGIWYGLYPASGIELVEVKYHSSKSTLVATKLTGNDFVGAGRVTWEISPPSGSEGTSCKVVSSLWQHVYTPRWDACSVEVEDVDHMAVTLHLGHEGKEVISFVRAVLPALLRWDDPLSPTHGFHRSMVICGVDAEDESTSVLEAFFEVH